MGSIELKEKLLSTKYFIDNEWLSKYIELINSNRDNPYINGYSQRHHILQKSYFKIIKEDIDNSKENLVNLSYTDHILAHYYLCLCTKEKVKFANAQAFQWLCDTSYKKCSEDIIKENFKYWEEIYAAQIEGKRHQNTDSFVVPVDIFDRDGNILYYCKSLQEASDILAVSIQAVCQAIRDKHLCKDTIVCASGDAESKREMLDKIHINDDDRVYQYDLNGKLVKVYNDTASIGDYDKSQIRHCICGRILTTQGFIWLKSSESIDERMLKISNMKNYSNNKKVYAFNQNGELEFNCESVGDMAKMLDTYPNRIRACCDNKIKTIKGYVLQYNNELDEDRWNSIKNNKFINIDNITVEQYDLSGNYIQTFNSVNEVREKLKIYHINECLQGKRKSAGGYIWKKAEVI